MALEPGLVALTEWSVELGGLELTELISGGIVNITGLESLADLEGESEDGAGDGLHSGDLSMSDREITITLQPRPGGVDPSDAHVAVAAAIRAIKAVMAPLPDRTRQRLLRWRMPGEPAKRLSVRPAVGSPLTLNTTKDRVTMAAPELTIRLSAPDPVVLSDEYHEQVFTAGQIHTVVNDGDLCAVMPSGWWLEAPGGVTLSHEDWPGEQITLPSGPVTVSRHREVVGPGTYGLVTGYGGSATPMWPLLRPGANQIKATAACTLRWRDTYP